MTTIPKRVLFTLLMVAALVVAGIYGKTHVGSLWARPAEPGKPMVTVKPGDMIIHNGERLKVEGVSIYRALPVDGGYDIVG